MFFRHTSDFHHQRTSSFPLAQQPNTGQDHLILEGSGSHTLTHHTGYYSSGRLISQWQRPLPVNTHTHKTDRHSCFRRDFFFLLSIYPLFYINSVFTSHVVTRNIIGTQPRRNTHLYLIYVLLSSTFYPRYVRCYTDLVGTGPGIRFRHTAVSFRHL
jgi:hypothetical protein